MTRSALYIGVAALLAAACASAPETTSPGESLSPEEQAQAWVDRQLAREVELPGATELASADGVFRARVPARVAAGPRLEDESYLAELDIGAESPVVCWVYTTRVDLASSLSSSSSATRELLAQQFTIELAQFLGVDAGVVAGSPFIALDWIYRGDDGARKVVGLVKHRIAVKGDGSVYCLHNEMGYRQSFAEVFRALVDSIEYADPGIDPYYAEVSTLALGDQRIGVDSTLLTLQPDGNTLIENVSAMLVPVDVETLAATDTYDFEWSHADGTLINGGHVAADNGELVTNLRLDPRDDGTWQASGMFQSKDIDETIRAAEPIVSVLGEMLVLREEIARSGVGASVALPRWVPAADPTRLIESSVQVTDDLGGGRFKARLKSGPLEMDAIVDREGSAAWASMQVGAVTIVVERVHVDGAIQ